MNEGTSAPDIPTILAVDDSPTNLSLLANVLSPHYRVKLANGGAKAIELARAQPRPALILLDVTMPDVDGHQVLRTLRDAGDTADIPVIFLTANTAVEDERRGLGEGAADYISKPFSPAIVLARVENQLTVARARALLSDRNATLQTEVAARTRELVTMRDGIIHAMASLAETRDNETGNHIKRTQHYVAALARHLRHHPRFVAVLTDDNIELLFKSAPLHDIGKVGVPDRILLKPGKLDADEFEIMKCHTTYGRDAIDAVQQQIGGTNGFLQFASEIAYSHQEKWDGSGYPQQLAGDAIPVSARLMAVADVYDALISRRVYKPPFTHDTAVAMMREGRATHFDPDVLDAFIAIEAEFLAIAARFRDEG